MSQNKTLLEFLDSKTLYYDKIDYDVINRSYEILSTHIQLPYVIHLIGTNGKGTTGRFLSSFLQQIDKSVLHYSSPHIIDFNERIWINGSNSTDQELNNAHEQLQKILPSKYLVQLTYFEYTTLLAFLLSSDMDYIVLEAGLGGEFDATNVVENNLTLLTTVDLDHQDFLGDTVEEITATKVRSCNNSIIIGHQINSEVYETVQEQLKNIKSISKIEDYDTDISKYKEELPAYLIYNLKLAFSALKFLGIDKKDFLLPKLEGRFQKLEDNIIVDVGHNKLAAKQICKQLQKENKKYILIYNSYKDKDYKSILNILKPVLKELQIIRCDDSRMVDTAILEETISQVDIKNKYFNIDDMIKDENYLVFGSFIVVENFLKQYKGRLNEK
ncbi:MAG: bifunctional folylpolyglutamate synthase/dihydrofolate synthase [Campylobacterota bacterium]|nr:bifunctional folylpolyglutamate synthase/dihydrofolate synthase [Campylobacterota bacterium]